MKKFFLCLILIVTWTESQVKSVVFDLGGVLFFPKTSAIVRKIGLRSLALYALGCRKNPLKIKSRLFTLLNEAFISPINRPPVKAQDEHGNTLPYIMDAWLNGTAQSEKIITKFKEYLLKNKTLKAIEKKIFYCLAKIIFNPMLFAKAQIVSSDGIFAIKELKKQGYQVYVLSNWPSDSFSIVKNKNPELFDLFDGILISGDCHINKPNPAIYQQLLLQFELFPEETVFIDDQLINVLAAQQCGIHAIVCPVKGLLKKRPDFSLIIQMIRALNDY